MKKQILAAVLTIALIGSINLTGCQKAESVEGISSENTSSVSLSAESNNSQPEDGEEATSSDSEDGNTSPQPDLSVDEEGNVIDNHTGEAAEGYEVNSNGDVAGSSTGAGVAPEKEVTPTPAPQTSSIAGKPASPNTTSKPGTEANPIETPENTPSPGAGNTGGTATSTKPAPPASSKPGTPASGKPSETKPSHTHSYTAKTVAATCMAGGYTLHTCSCGDSYKDGQTAALGHSYGAWTVVKEATTTSEGSQTRTCSRCGVKETQSIPKVADKYSAYAAPSNANLIEERVLYYINTAQPREAQRQPACPT